MLSVIRLQKMQKVFIFLNKKFIAQSPIHNIGISIVFFELNPLHSLIIAYLQIEVMKFFYLIKNNSINSSLLL